MEQRQHAANKTCKTPEETQPDTTVLISTPDETDKLASPVYFKDFSNEQASHNVDDHQTKHS